MNKRKSLCKLTLLFEIVLKDKKYTRGGAGGGEAGLVLQFLAYKQMNPFKCVYAGLGDYLCMDGWMDVCMHLCIYVCINCWYICLFIY